VWFHHKMKYNYFKEFKNVFSVLFSHGTTSEMK